MITDIFIITWGAIIYAISSVFSLLPSPISAIPMSMIDEFFTWLKIAIAPLNGVMPIAASCQVIIIDITIILPCVLAIKVMKMIFNR